MKTCNITYLLGIVTLLLLSVVEAKLGSYTVDACIEHDGTKFFNVWDSDGGSSELVTWTPPTASIVVLGQNGVQRLMNYQAGSKGQVQITYRGKTLRWKSPNDRIIWGVSTCDQYWGDY
ncbi:hypothetical protein BGX26_004805 [Mortierella sp. AD094]|nr:hypothetical protein BGX26_004805 [Mortierella sp. AD094]